MFYKPCIKVPVVMQLENVECGAACLTMILAHYGKWVPLNQVREECGISRDGCNLNNITLAARNYGLEVHSYSCGLNHIMTKVKLPCIIHWHFNHFVVLNGFTKKGAMLTDPAQGRVVISIEEFSEGFTGVYMEFNKTSQFIADGKRQSICMFVKNRLSNSISPIIFILLTSVITCIIALIYPVLGRIFLDYILSKSNPNWLYNLISVMLLLLLSQIIVAVITGITSLKIQGKYAIHADYCFIKHVLRLPFSFFSKHMAGDISVRQDSNRTISYTLIQRLAPTFLNLVLLITYFFIMIQYNVLLTVIVVSITCINSILARIISTKRLEISRVQATNIGKLMSKTLNGLQMIESIKANGSESGFYKIWAGNQAAVNNTNIRLDNISISWGMIPQLIEKLGNIIILTLGAFYIMKNHFTVGMLLAFQGFMAAFIQPVNSLISAGQAIQEMRSSMERIEDIMQTKPDSFCIIDSSYKTESFEYLELNNISFGYSKYSNPVIDDFNLKIQSGTSIAIVGTSGCGKSTLSKLISGLFEPWSGEISYFDNSLNEIPSNVFRKLLAVVDQNIVLFEDTIENNIKLWDSSITDEQMYAAAQDAQIHSTIMDRQNGYQEILLENGNNLSGGQRQCIEIARVLAQNPQVIIFDEATSALDADTEYKVMQAIRSRNITLIIISHRLSIVRDCDEIIVMDNGKISERGSHNELFKQNKMYTKYITTE
ncbi:ATP-binding cassette domain-containing protein [Clostridium botulinum]|uniref:ATP-binding cassette domain-containing protein n=1 Tax=Clostridium botulinum TaxID=1491 RepID=A0A6G4HRR8_CLOBO|nr:cysteine peptidase family C39 domain-containing protein [Clostridium botulinum]MBD5586061.1 ATP-binding cassette domain-containing protein [Clostridium botulinum]NFJ59717.1 ATP-binding cassette domain-containing protein [Clostridium botulinum]NFJ67520.1 ATP-binding cassette domain-containing protein [Clostridium botulinum]NFM78796.1 ATP-binding cassette domain-containing protein [Clostridium botulinum]NFQ64132.1 ATP-binding cassette domain-containing protein [Clostridium botulinum]